MSPDAEGAELVEAVHRFMRGMEGSSDGHDRGGQLDRLRRRLRARDGLRLPHRRGVRHLRPARDQPRDHPRLRRHAAAAAAGGGGQGARDEPHRRADRRLRGAPRGARQPGGARPRAVRHRAGLGAQAGRPGADRHRGDQAPFGAARSRRGARAARPRASAARSGPRTPRRASAPSSASAGPPSRAGDGRGRQRDGAARRAAARGAPCRGAHRGRHLGAVGDPGLPLAGHRAVGERGPDGGGPHRRLAARSRPLLELLRRAASRRWSTSSPTRPTWRWPSSSAAA